MTSATKGHTLRALQRLDEWGGLSKIGRLLADSRRRPNLFLVAPRMMGVEGVHSDLLAWMLDPSKWHGLGDRFVCALIRPSLERCGLSGDLPIRIDDVISEASTGRGPVDILLRLRVGDERVVLGVENKIDAPEGEEQLRRYCAGLRMKFPRETIALVFVTPTGREPRDRPECPVAAISHGDIARLIEHAIAGATPADDGVGLEIVRHYVGAVRTHVMNEPNPEIDALCRTLLDDHREAWEVIRRRLPSRRDDLHASIGARVCEWLEQEGHGAWRFVVRRDRYACLFREEWFGLGTFAAHSLVDVGQPLVSGVGYPRVHFRLVAETSTSDADEGYGYTLRLKVDSREKPDLGRVLVHGLRSIDSLHSKIPARDQWTMNLKSTSSLPALGDESSGVPDRVVEWYARQLIPVVGVIDGVFRDGPS